MSNPTELPDLDRDHLDYLERVARAATKGPWDTHPITDDELYPRGLAITAAGGETISDEDTGPGDDDAAFIAAANPAAVLALIALARRAQPESEAPQAEPVAWRFREYDDREKCHSRTWCITMDRGAMEIYKRYGAVIEPLYAAAQQAAAPGAQALLNADELAALRRFDETCQDGEGYDVPKAMMQRLAAIGVVRRTSGSFYETTDFGLRVLDQPAPSAPGTPEAPAEDRKGIALWQATMRACGELPEGYEVRIELENGCGMAVWCDAEGERHVIDGDGYLSDDVNEAVDAAIQRAARLDGGQGEGKVEDVKSCWSCGRVYTHAQRADADGHCPHCSAEIVQEVSESNG